MLFCALLSLPSWGQRTGTGSRPGGGTRPSPATNRNAVPVKAPQAAPNAALSVPTAKNASQEGDVEFRSETVLVQVPVVVTDKSGNHIHDLKKADFHVFENGKEQTISAFDEVVAHGNRLPTPAPLPVATFTNVVANSTQPLSVTVVAIDEVNTPFLDQAYARKELIKYLAANLDSTRPVALVLITSKGLQVVHSLTSDTATLLDTLKKISGQTHDMQNVDTETQVAAATGTNLFALSPASMTQDGLQNFISQGDIDYSQFKQENAIETTLNAFLGLAWTLSGVPGRKSVLWATGSFPFFMDSPGSLPGDRLSVLYERTMQALNDAEVAIYPIDARGLVNYSPVADASISRLQHGAAGAQQLSGRAWLHTMTLDTLNDFAEVTGGRAFYNTNDLAGAFKRAADDGSDYYMLGYYLDTKNTKPGWRQLKVKLDRKEVDIRARQGFLVTNVTMNPQLTRDQDMSFALTSPFEATGLPIMVQWKGESDPKDKTPDNQNKKEVEFVVHVARNALTIEGTHNEYNVDFMAVAASKNAVAGNVGQNVKGSLSPPDLEKIRNSGLGYHNVIDLAPGTYSVRFVVRDNLSGRLGSITAPLTVN
jgi:VWFA-related protein